MTEYKAPKQYGNKVAVGTRFTPEQHRLAMEGAKGAGLSMAEYLGALVEKAAGRPNKLDNRKNLEKEQLPLDH